MSKEIIPIIVAIIVPVLGAVGYLIKRYHFDIETNLNKKKEALSIVLLKYSSQILSGTLRNNMIEEIQNASNSLFIYVTSRNQLESIHDDFKQISKHINRITNISKLERTLGDKEFNMLYESIQKIKEICPSIKVSSS